MTDTEIITFYECMNDKWYYQYWAGIRSFGISIRTDGCQL